MGAPQTGPDLGEEPILLLHYYATLEQELRKCKKEILSFCRNENVKNLWPIIDFDTTKCKASFTIK